MPEAAAASEVQTTAFSPSAQAEFVEGDFHRVVAVAAGYRPIGAEASTSRRGLTAENLEHHGAALDAPCAVAAGHVVDITSDDLGFNRFIGPDRDAAEIRQAG